MKVDLDTRIGQGSTVWIEYTLETEDTVVEAATAENPLELQIGSGRLHPVLESALIGRQVGESLVVRLDPSLGFGEHKEELVIKIAKSKLPPHLQQCPVGHGFEAPGPDRKRHWFRCVESETEQMVFDANHPLAGETLEWHAKILKCSEVSG
jgi:FKBP-type peptidyl-prolyl cis-trans isomerase 2